MMNREKKLLIFSLIVILFVSGYVLLYFTTPTPTWQKTYGGADNETGHLVINAIKSGYLALGTKRISNDSDVLLLRTDYFGNLTSQNTFGGPGDDYGYSIRQALAGGYVLVGKTNSYGVGGYSAWLVKVNENITPSYNVTYGGSGDDAVYSFKETKDSRYILAGNTTSFGSGASDVYLLKVDPDGALQWQKAYGGPGEEWGKSVVQSQNANFWVLGSTNSYGAGNYDFYLVETNPQGDMVMNRTYGGGGDDFGDGIIENMDGSFLLTGLTTSYGMGSSDAWMIKTDQYGNLMWNKTFGGPGDDNCTFSRETNDHGYLIIGNTNSWGAGGSDIFVLKTDIQGNKQWNQTFGGPGNEYASFILQTLDRGYLLIGTTDQAKTGQSNVLMIKMDLNGNLA